MTTKHQQPKKGGNSKEMSCIESNLMPFVSTIGFVGIVGFLQILAAMKTITKNLGNLSMMMMMMKSPIK